MARSLSSIVDKDNGGHGSRSTGTLNAPFRSGDTVGLRAGLCPVRRLPPGEGGLGVNLAQGEIAVDRGEPQNVFQSAQFRQEPLVTLTGVSLNADPILGDEHVLAQGCQPAVTRELMASVVGLGRRRKDLDDDGRVEQRVQFAVPGIPQVTDQPIE
jgi:hypothetical protein